MNKKPQYEVISEINPRYLETGYPCDYYGVYNVVEITSGKVVKTFENMWGREEAYKLAAKLAANRYNSRT